MWCEAALVSLAMAVALPIQAATITADIGNVRNARGQVHVEVCPEGRFLKEDCPYTADTPARTGVTAIIIRNVPPGLYAVQAYHDENDNRRVDRALFGIPREGVGFSNDARITFGPPKWKDAVFSVAGETHIHLNLRYFLGPSGPPPAH